MAKKSLPLIDSPQATSNKDSLLSVLTETPQDNLLEEAMKSKGAVDFGKATGEAYQKLSELRAQEDDTTQKQADEAQESTTVEEEEQKVPEEDAPESVAAEDDTRWYALNEEQQRYAQRQEMLERELLAERQASRQALEELKKSVPREQESYDFDFTNPEGIRAFEERVYNRARNEFRQSQEPLLRQLASKEFQSTVSQLATKHEHFNKYFPQNVLQQYFQAASQRFPVDQLLALDWGKELSLAYQAADYQRLSQEVEKLKTGKVDDKKIEQKGKEEQKANLKLVPKANSRSTSTKPGINDELDEWRKNHSGRFGMEDVSAQLKRKMGLG